MCVVVVFVCYGGDDSDSDSDLFVVWLDDEVVGEFV